MPDLDLRDVAHADGDAATRRDDDLGELPPVLDHPDAEHQARRAAALDHPAADVGVAALEGAVDVPDRQAEALEPARVHHDVPLLLGAAPGVDLRDPADGAELGSQIRDNDVTLSRWLRVVEPE